MSKHVKHNMSEVEKLLGGQPHKPAGSGVKRGHQFLNSDTDFEDGGRNRKKYNRRECNKNYFHFQY